MRKSACMLLGLAALAVLTGCSSVSFAFPFFTHTTSTELTQRNFRVVKSNVRGESRGFWLLGWPLPIPIVSPSSADAMSMLHESAQMDGRSMALANVVLDRGDLYLIVFTIPKVVVTADVIEFTDSSTGNQ